MRQKPGTKQSHGEKVVKDIRRATRKQYSAEEKIRIVLDGLKGEDSIADGKSGGRLGNQFLMNILYSGRIIAHQARFS